MLKQGKLIALVLSLVFAEPAFSGDNLSASIDWWVSISDTIVVADVIQVKALAIESLDWKSQFVSFKTKSVLKGDRLDGLSVRQEFLDLARFFGGDHFVVDRGLKVGDQALVFIARRDKKAEPEVIFWVNLTKPDGEVAPHAALDNDSNWLADAPAILKLARARIELENRTHRSKGRGILIARKFTGKDGGFVRTADPDYKSVLVEQLKKEDLGPSLFAIYDLISYPDKETIGLLLPFLKDQFNYEYDDPDAKDRDGKPIKKKVKVYPRRGLAYVALTLLGESPPRPDGVPDEYRPGEFEEYFENRARFPFGDWKRLEFPPESKVTLGKVPPESLARADDSELAKTVNQICAEEKGDYHRLLWRAYHLIDNSTIGRPWKEIEGVVGQQKFTRLSVDDFEYKVCYEYELKKGAFVTSKGLSHDLVAKFDVRLDTDKSPQLARVAQVHVMLVATVDKPLVDFVRSNPYPAGTIAEKAITVVEGAAAAKKSSDAKRDFDGVANALKNCPVLNKLKIEYEYGFDRWTEFNPHIFSVDLTLVDKVASPSKLRAINVWAVSGFDPPQSWFGEKQLCDFKSRDTLEEADVSVSYGW